LSGKDMQRFKNEVALITGGGSGIGRATAVRFAQEVAMLAVNDLTEDKLPEVVETTGGLAVAGDVSKRKNFEQMMKKTLNAFGRLDILMNNAGISHVSPVPELKEADWDRMIAVHHQWRGLHVLARISNVTPEEEVWPTIAT